MLIERSEMLIKEGLAVAMHGVNQAQVRPGEKVALFGCGRSGLA